MCAQRRRRAVAADEVRPRDGRGGAGTRGGARRTRGWRGRRRRMTDGVNAAPTTAAPTMQPLAAMPRATRTAIRGVLADIDDTISTHGRLHASAYAALERLRDAGKLVI